MKLEDESQLNLSAVHLMDEPRHKQGDIVEFWSGSKHLVGTIKVRDRYGALLWYGKCPTYDILVGDDTDLSKCLWVKHIPEHHIKRSK